MPVVLSFIGDPVNLIELSINSQDPFWLGFFVCFISVHQHFFIVEVNNSDGELFSGKNKISAEKNRH